MARARGNDDGHQQDPADRATEPDGVRPSEENLDLDEREDGDSDRLASFGALVFAVGLVAGALLVGALWGTLGQVGNGSADTTAPAADQHRAAGNPTVLGTEQSRPSHSVHPGPAKATKKAVGVSDAEACTQVVAARRAALDAATPAMDQWSVHIGAMNKLVVGAITLAQANAFWASTRTAAHQKIHQFQVADNRARSLTVTCPPAALVDDATAFGCARTAAQQGAALDAVRSAIRTWKRHVHDMEMLRMGHMSGAMATQMWLASWHRGVAQLRAYQQALDRVPGDACPA